VQYLILRNVIVINEGSKSTSRTTLMTKDSLTNVIDLLKNESWYDIFPQNDIKRSFN
jgi:hypothetical protein